MTNQHPSHLSQQLLIADLDEWLSYLETIHTTEIDMGLERISIVADRLNINLSNSSVITVAGTNGKGTTCAFLENALLNEGQSVAVYSSPHLNRFNERLRVNKSDVDDVAFINAFKEVELARAEISLTYYEYTTLAAFIIIQRLALDVVILEVGLGGRLDATNIIDADISVITSIDLDHQAFLGTTREAIGLEKAGILRENKWAVIGEPDIPSNVLNFAEQLKTKLVCRDSHFAVTQLTHQWHWQYQDSNLNNLQLPHIPVNNVATALTVLSLLNVELNTNKVNKIIETTKVPGRTELVEHRPDVILDVGHNPHATRYLAEVVKKHRSEHGKVYAVIAMLADKDIVHTIEPLVNQVDYWHLAGLDVHRGADVNTMHNAVNQIDLPSHSVVNSFDNVVDAYRIAKQNANPADLILVFGSFFTVAQVREQL